MKKPEEQIPDTRPRSPRRLCSSVESAVTQGQSLLLAVTFLALTSGCTSHLPNSFTQRERSMCTPGQSGQASPSGNFDPAGAGTLPPTAVTAQSLITNLKLQQHVEGGWFRRTYESGPFRTMDTAVGERFAMTSIHYMLTADSPVGHWHLNLSDIVHYYHLGDPIDYYLITSDGRLIRFTLGPDITQGQQLQFTVPGGTWKASELRQGPAGYGLISEAVSPGFDYDDMTLGTADAMLAQYPQHEEVIVRFTRN